LGGNGGLCPDGETRQVFETVKGRVGKRQNKWWLGVFNGPSVPQKEEEGWGKKKNPKKKKPKETNRGRDFRVSSKLE